MTGTDEPSSPAAAITVSANGPHRVSGGLALYRRRDVQSELGEPMTWKTTATLETKERYALCLLRSVRQQAVLRRYPGPLWVTAMVPVINSDGTRLEARNRVTLCRCGVSSNKPLCDGSHKDAGFTEP